MRAEKVDIELDAKAREQILIREIETLNQILENVKAELREIIENPEQAATIAASTIAYLNES